jgi:hypothetical protein
MRPVEPERLYPRSILKTFLTNLRNRGLTTDVVRGTMATDVVKG